MREAERPARPHRWTGGRGIPCPAPLKALLRVSLALLIAAPSFAAETVVYRYTNAQGEPVFSYTLPPEQVKAGYQKIDMETGQVLESVAPQLPAVELAEKLRREKAEKACRDELDRLYQLYGSESDIDHARAEALASLDTRIEQLQANLRQAEREQNRLRGQAADAERAGREIPPTLLQNIDGSRSQIRTLKAEIAQRHQEEQQADARFAHDHERFRDGTCTGTLADAGTADRATVEATH